ncbi:acyl-CoA dehydrogenase family protein [Mycolicibacterium sarraceniae]|uniref:Acyl-CoA dehydrogenase n=1 Tax=Mycolicibacterium sarraceniae TaxID=1534348 RepID=A0A7I7T0K3_9MYCO|nr:acyl-CoA dehydrogenase family protein [Mycolicibacterium sarraceniae]BBY61596.1 acyl-CoA dehydrogenase [Mycolicibacterium sarraceniae]
MDFELDEPVRELGQLASTIFDDRSGVERVKHVESTLGGHDAELWSTLAETGVLGAALPEQVGGAGLGMLGLVTILEAQGRRVAPVPLWPVLAGAALPIAEFGTADQRSRWLDGVVAGTTLVAGAPGASTVRGTRHHDRIVLDGQLPLVFGGAVADAIVVPVRCDDEELVAIVPTEHLTVTPVQVISRVSAAAVTFDDVSLTEADLLGGGKDVGAWILGRCRTAIAGLQAGICHEALAMAAAYTSQRIQFGRPLSTNQAVAMRAADAHLDTVAIRLSAQRAAWLMDRGDEQAAVSAALVAKWWASHGGLRTVHATQHLHGGMGADLDYPIHRYFIWGRDAAFSLGGADAVAAELGDLLPSAPAIGAPL